MHAMVTSTYMYTVYTGSSRSSHTHISTQERKYACKKVIIKPLLTSNGTAAGSQGDETGHVDQESVPSPLTQGAQVLRTRPTSGHGPTLQLLQAISGLCQISPSLLPSSVTRQAQSHTKFGQGGQGSYPRSPQPLKLLYTMSRRKEIISESQVYWSKDAKLKNRRNQVSKRVIFMETHTHRLYTKL